MADDVVQQVMREAGRALGHQIATNVALLMAGSGMTREEARAYMRQTIAAMLADPDLHEPDRVPHPIQTEATD